LQKKKAKQRETSKPNQFDLYLREEWEEGVPNVMMGVEVDPTQLSRAVCALQCRFDQQAPGCVEL